MHTDTQFTTATVIIAISQPFKCLADQLHSMVAQSQEIYQYNDFSTNQTLHPPSVKTHLRIRGKHDVLPHTPTCQTIYFGKFI